MNENLGRTYTLPIVSDGDEMVRTSVGYGTPGGYMLTVIRADHLDSRVALLYVDNTLVADMMDCDSVNARVEVYHHDGGSVGPWSEAKARRVINLALEQMAELYDAAEELEL